MLLKPVLSRRCADVMLIVALWLAAATPAQALLGAQDGFFEHPCGFDTIRARCGYMSVPEDHAAPDGKRIQFPVVILSAAAVELREPVVVLGGGGPGNTIGLDEVSLHYHVQLFQQSFLTKGRTVVLMDQRGVGSARPATACSEVVAQLEETYSKPLTGTQEWRASRQSLTACKQRLAAAGIDLRHYDTVQSAADVEALRQSLGIDRWVLYGASYGGQLALEVVRRYPHAVAALLLDSPSAPQFPYYERAGELADEAIERLFSSCAQDTQCAQHYPELRSNTLEVLDRLAHTPVQLMLAHPRHGSPYTFVMDRSRLVDVLYDALYDPVNIEILPAALTSAHNGRYGAMVPFITGFLNFQFDERFGDGMSIATTCREEVSHTDPARIPAYTEVFSGRDTRQQFEQARLLCDALDLGTVEPQVKLPVRTRIPALILSGEHDPITPAWMVRGLLEHMDNAILVSFAEESHYVFYNPCARLLAAAWLEDTASARLEVCPEGFRRGVSLTTAR